MATPAELAHELDSKALEQKRDEIIKRMNDGDPRTVLATLAEIERARKEYAHGSDDNIEIDDDARVSRADDGGVWVEAWVYLSAEDTDNGE